MEIYDTTGRLLKQGDWVVRVEGTELALAKVNKFTKACVVMVSKHGWKNYTKHENVARFCIIVDDDVARMIIEKNPTIYTLFLPLI
jgi:hypothetical protein